MELTFHRIDISDTSPQRNPYDRIPREAADMWLVAFGPVLGGENADWRYFKRERSIHIPMIPYLMAPDPELAMAFMLQLGLACANDFGRPLKRMHIAMGHPVNVVEESGERFWQCYVGIAVVLQQ